MNFRRPIVFATFAVLLFSVNLLAQGEIDAIGQSLTDLTISVERKGFTEAMPLSEVPRLEKNDKLVFEFIKNPQDTVDISRQPYRRLVVFFVDPRAVINDVKNNPNSVQERRLYYKKRWQRKLTFTVPYTSFPLIFLNSGGSYKRTLKKLVLSNEANIQSLAENSVVIAEYPRMINFLIEARKVLQTRPAENSKVLHSIIENSKLFKLDQTDCFKGEYLKKKNTEKISCLINNLNVSNFKDDFGKISWDKIATKLASEAVGQLRNKYQGLNVYLDVAVLIFRIISDLYSKKPLTVELASLIPIRDERPGETLRLFKTPINSPPGHSKGLILIPMEWRDNDEIFSDEQIDSMEIEPVRSCFSEGENLFRIKTEYREIKREIREFRLSFRKGTPSRRLLSREDVRLNLAKDQFEINIGEDEWRRIGEGRITGVLKFDYNFKEYEKTFEMLSLPEAKWELIENRNPIRRGEDTDKILITPNTARRDCIDKIVISDSSETRTALTKPKSTLRFNGNFIEILLSKSDKDKFQAGEIFLNVYEPANDAAVNAAPLRFNLLGPKPSLTKFTIRQGDKIGMLEGTGLGEIESLSVNGEPVASFDAETGDVILASHVKGFTANLTGKLRAGDTIGKSFGAIPTADIINGRLDCDSKNNSSSITPEIKTAYKPYTFSNCVIPVDTDALNLVLISRVPYQFRSAQKPNLILEVEKEALRFETIQILGPLGEVKNSRRMDARIPITQPIKDWLRDGKKLFLRFIDKDFGESKRYEFAIDFAMLPKTLTLDCRKAEGKECELTGDVGVIAQASTNAEEGSTKWVNADLSDTKLKLPKLGYEKFFFIRLRSNSSQIRIDLKDLRNTSVKYFEAPPETLDINLN